MSFAGLQVDDLCHGANDWRNIQEVVRASFKIFYDVICDQSERIQQLTAALSDVNAALAEKVWIFHQSDSTIQASKQALADISRDLRASIDTKASVVDVNAALQEKVLKSPT